VQAADDAMASSATVNEMRLLQLTDLPPVDHSRILGSAYRRQRRYRPLPAVPRVLQDHLKSDVYARLPFHETVSCLAKDLQMPGWMFDEHAAPSPAARVWRHDHGHDHGFSDRWTHHLEQPAGRRDICPVSVNLPSAFKNISVPGLVP